MSRAISPDVYNQADIIRNKRLAAHAKHGESSIESVPISEYGKWLAILMEEVGELAHEFTYDGDSGNVLGELFDIAAVVSAMIERAREAGHILRLKP